jgi:hypothetical protein
MTVAEILVAALRDPAVRAALREALAVEHGEWLTMSGVAEIRGGTARAAREWLAREGVHLRGRRARVERRVVEDLMGVRAITPTRTAVVDRLAEARADADADVAKTLKRAGLR